MSNTTPSHDGTIEPTADGGWIRFERHLAYPIGEVWDAVTNPARLADWWLPFEADITVDLRVGGDMVFRSRDDETVAITCTIRRLDPPVLLEHTHVDDGAFLRWELEPEGAGCVLRLSHFVTDVHAAINNCYLVGLDHSLSRLEPSLAGHPAPWDWSAFAAAQAAYARAGLAPEPEPSAG